MSLALRESGGDLVTSDGEVLDLRGQPTALEAITRAEIDMQVATANRYPRSIQKFMREAEAMISLSPEIAEKCRYKLPPRKDADGNMKVIEGPSVRLAEIVTSCYRNMMVAGRIVEDDGKMVTAQGVAFDMERNVRYSVEVKRRVTTKKGWRYSDDMVAVTCNAAIAIATRNAAFKVVPRSFVQALEGIAINVMKGDVKTLPERLDRALRWFAEKGVPEAVVFKRLGVGGRADVTLDHLVDLNGYKVAIQDGQATAAEIFEPTAVAETPESTAGSRAGRLAEKLGPQVKDREPGEDDDK